MDDLDDSALRGFARCLAGEDALPVCRSSRVYTSLAPVFDHALICCPALSLQASCSPTAQRKKRKTKTKKKSTRTYEVSVVKGAAVAAETTRSSNSEFDPTDAGGDPDDAGDVSSGNEGKGEGGDEMASGFAHETTSPMAQSKNIVFFPSTTEIKVPTVKATEIVSAWPTCEGPCVDAKGATAPGDGVGEDEDEDTGDAIAAPYALGGLGSTGVTLAAEAPLASFIGPEHFRNTRPWAPRVLPPLDRGIDAAQMHTAQAIIAAASLACGRKEDK